MAADYNCGYRLSRDAGESRRVSGEDRALFAELPEFEERLLRSGCEGEA